MAAERHGAGCRGARIFLLVPLFWLIPEVVHADPWLMKVQFTLAPLPRLLIWAARGWFFLLLLLALGQLWRVIRGPVEEAPLAAGSGDPAVGAAGVGAGAAGARAAVARPAIDE